jgi:actin, other eukaryote
MAGRSIMVGMGQRDCFIGDEAVSKRGILLLTYPIEKGMIQNFDYMERIWHHTFYNELKVAPEEHPVIMNEELGNTKANREKITEIMFETFNVPAFFLEQSSLFSLYCSGRTTGTVLNMGHTKNDVCCIYDGSVLPKGEVNHLAGRELTEHLRVELNQFGYSFRTTAEIEIVEDIKEKYCFVRNSQDYGEKNYELPDGNIITIPNEIRYSSVELLFDKYQVFEELSIQEIISNCIKSKDSEIHDEMYKNVILSGGGSMFDGISERLKDELQQYHSKEVKVIAPPERKYSHWIGASVLTSLSSFHDKWITKDQYDEYGPDIVNKMCFNNVGVNHKAQKSNNLSGNLVSMLGKNKLTDIHIQ